MRQKFGSSKILTDINCLTLLHGRPDGKDQMSTEDVGPTVIRIGEPIISPPGVNFINIFTYKFFVRTSFRQLFLVTFWL